MEFFGSEIKALFTNFEKNDAKIQCTRTYAV